MSIRRNKVQTAGKAALILLAIGALSGLSAAGSAIGMVMTNGNFQVDHARVSGNTTLFDGSLIETARASSQIHLNNGIQMRLGAGTRATVFQSRLVLEDGQSEMAPALGFAVEARSLRITGLSTDALARIKVDGGRRVLVAAVRGALKVSNAAGVMVARIESGDALNFEPQTAGAMAATHASGCLLEKNGRFILVDRTTNVVLELQGASLGKQTGNRVEITGRTEAVKPQVADASQVIEVLDMKLVAKGGCSAIAKKLGAATAATAAAGAGAAGAGAAGAAGVGAATAAGIGAGTVAVIGGVAAAATVGGLAAVGELPGQSDAQASSSR